MALVYISQLQSYIGTYSIQKEVYWQVISFIDIKKKGRPTTHGVYRCQQSSTKITRIKKNNKRREWLVSQSRQPIQ